MKFAFVAVIATLLCAQAFADAKCNACEAVITVVDKYLDEGKTHEEIKKLVETICAYTGPSYAEICTALLDGELESIIKMIESMTPKQVCQKIKLCPAEIKANAVECQVCKIVVDAIEQYIETPKTEQQIINLLDKLCAMFPKYESVCDQLVAYGIMELVELIKQHGDATVVCQKIKLCD
jgi:uncharacterized protein YqeY